MLYWIIANEVHYLLELGFQPLNIVSKSCRGKYVLRSPKVHYASCINYPRSPNVIFVVQILDRVNGPSIKSYSYIKPALRVLTSVVLVDGFMQLYGTEQ